MPDYNNSSSRNLILEIPTVNPAQQVLDNINILKMDKFASNKTYKQKISFNWKTWRLRNQAIVLMVTESVFLLILVIVADYEWQQIVKPYFLDASHTLMGLEFNKEILQMTALYTASTKELIYRNFIQIMRMRDVFTFVQDNPINIVQPVDCLGNQSSADKYSYLGSFCYYYYGGVSHDLQDPYILNYTSLLTQTYIMQDLSFNAFFTSVRNSDLFALYPGKYLAPGFNSHTRPWYINDLAQNMNGTAYVSPPYKSTLLKIYVMTQTTDLLLNGVLEGVAGSEINFNTLTLFKQQLNGYNFQIIGNSGIIYLSMNNSLIGQYIQNQSLTGFDDDDYNQIMHSMNGSAFQSNCMTTKLLNLNYLCRINEMYNSEQYIMTTKVAHTDLIIILFVTPSLAINEIEKQIITTNDELDSLFVNFTLIYLGIRMVSIITCACIFYVLLAPIDKIIKFTKVSKSPIEKFRHLMDYKNMTVHSKDDVLYNFKETYDSLLNRMTTSSIYKSESCQEIEDQLEYEFKEQFLSDGYHRYQREKYLLIQLRFYMEKLPIDLGDLADYDSSFCAQ